MPLLFRTDLLHRVPTNASSNKYTVWVGEGIVSLFNCWSRPIKINKGDMIAECADIINNFNPASASSVHDSMLLLT